MDRTGRRPPRAGPLPVAARPGTPLPGRRCRLTRNPPHQTSPPKGIAMKALITAYVRSPFHFARKGALADMRPDTLAAQVVTGLLQRTGIDPATLEDVITGCAYPEAGLGEAYLCIGVESMTMVPQGGFNFSPHPALYEHSDAYISMGETAENVAQRYAVTRADQEALAVASHRKAAAARDAGRLQAEIVPITPASGDMVAQDGCIRPGTTPEALAALRPAFRDDGVVTAGTSSPLTDGAVAVLVTTEAYATRHGLAPLARILAMATAGVDPAYMGMGPVPATRKALARAGIAAQDLDVVEINEAFGSQALACIRELGLREDAINLDGGGLAIGHPLGATGARITGKAAALLQREKGRYALATQCIGGGQGIATVLGAV